MPMKTPLTYLRQRRDQAHARKPTTHAKVVSYSYINPQITSPLFTQIPGEIRHLIYEYALLASPDHFRPFSKHSYHYRPGYTHARSININFLLTCRRVYLEADHLAISQNEHLIYQPTKHGPPGHRPYLLPSAAASSNSKRRGLLKYAQREMIQQVHIFAQQYWLEDWNQQWYDYCKSWAELENGHPERLKITIRHTDWWYYLLGENSPLALDPKRANRAPPKQWIPDEAPFMEKSWGSRFKLLKGLRVFELELETLERKRNELDEVVEKAYGWKLPLSGDEVLACDRDATTYYSWTGSRHFKGLNGRNADPTPGLHLLQGMGASRPTISRTNSIATTTSKIQASIKRSDSDASRYPGLWQEEELSPEDRLEYYVVTLTFYAQPAPKDNEKGKGKEREEEGEVEEIVRTGNGGAPGAVPAVPTPPAPPHVLQGMFTPTPWVPRRSGFPTAYG